MRLICPNCDAEYEVDDDVIPPGGRDVQCSNCGHTWFQPAAGEGPPPDEVADEEDFPDEDDSGAEVAAWDGLPEEDAPAAPDKDILPDTETGSQTDTEDAAPDGPEEPAPEPEPAVEKQRTRRPALDDSLAKL